MEDGEDGEGRIEDHNDFYFSFGYLPMIILWFLFDVFGFELK